MPHALGEAVHPADAKAQSFLGGRVALVGARSGAESSHAGPHRQLRVVQLHQVVDVGAGQQTPRHSVPEHVAAGLRGVPARDRKHRGTGDDGGVQGEDCSAGVSERSGGQDPVIGDQAALVAY